jgi:uncharacterized membrane protein YcaP (DUF421 family)
MYTIIHAIVGYFFLLLTVRVLSRRPGAQLTPFEFVIVFLIGGVIILATVGDDKSVTNCVGAILTVVLLHQFVSWLRTSTRVEDDDVMAAARTKGVKDLSGIKYAILERNGTISIIKADQKSPKD